MSTVDARALAARARTRGAHARDRLVAVVFGDRVGLALFLVALAVYALYWRVGFFITDNWTVANTLVAVADGHLYVERAHYGPTLASPGMHVVDGRLYGRNYGHVVAALPALWALRAVAAVADPRIALAAGWSLLLLGTATVAGRALDRERPAVLAGSVLAVVAFLANVAVATPLDPRWFALMALQVTTMVAAALVGVVCYRLLARMHARRVGLAAGVAVALSTPVGFWATVPKRHAVTALLTVCVLYSLYRAREAGSTRHRALAYVWVGLAAWVHAPEALVLLVALVPVDLATAEDDDPRTLAAVAAAFALSLVPFLATNWLVVGNPVEPPRLWTPYDGGETTGGGIEAGDDGGLGSDRDGGPGDSGGTAPSLPAPLVSVLGKFLLLWHLLTEGFVVAAARPERLLSTFVRSGYIPGVAADDGGQAISLTVLESAPLVGTALATPLVAARRWSRSYLSTPRTAADLFALVAGVLFTVVYLPRLPLHAQVTVRYLLPVFPLLAYAGARLPSVRRVVRERWRGVAWTYAATVLVGGQLLFAGFVLTDAALGEAMQAHALLGLGLALAVGAWAVAAATGRDHDRVGALVLGLAAGEGTVFVLLSGLYHFAYAGEFALPLVP